jgi:glutathione synthase/RimK-type ligase-like ATP-grasp enzyme
MVLCITHSQDFYNIDIVQQALQQAGMPSFRFNSDEFALNCKLNYMLRNGERENYLLINGQKITASQISGVWYRKLWKMKVPDELDMNYREVFIKEYATYQQLFFDQLQHVPWMNSMQQDHVVGNDKLLQLTHARQAGLVIPETIFTNDPEHIRNFFDECKGELVVKLHGALSRSMEGNTPFFPTTKLSPSDMEKVDQLAYCPMIFQQYIPKEYELRVVYVDGSFFAGKIPNEHAGVTDWRTISNHRVAWQQYELPESEQEKIHNMMQSLQLTFGAIDIIKNTNGEFVFLEVNPQGEWGMLQKYLDYPIGQTIANKLITRINNG